MFFFFSWLKPTAMDFVSEQAQLLPFGFSQRIWIQWFLLQNFWILYR